MFVLIARVCLLSASIGTFPHSLPFPHWCCVAEGIAWTPINSHDLKTGMGARAGGLGTSWEQKKSYIYVSPSKAQGPLWKRGAERINELEEGGVL